MRCTLILCVFVFGIVILLTFLILKKKSNVHSYEKINDIKPKARSNYSDSLRYLDNTSLLRTVISISDLLDSIRAKKILASLEMGELELTNDRHLNYPTRDIPTYRIPCLEVEMGKAFNELIRPAISTVWGVPEDHLILIDEFLVEYDADGRNHLDVHIDGHTFSYIVQVNDNSEFKGGGTRFIDTNQVFNADLRGAIIFCGRRKHQGLPITEGRRVIITGFVDISYKDETAFKFEPLLKAVNAHVRAFTTQRIPNLHLYPNLSYILDSNGVQEEDIFEVLYSGKQLLDTSLHPPSEKWAIQLRNNGSLLAEVEYLYQDILGHMTSRDLKICIAGNLLRIVTGETDCKKYPELCYGKPYLA